MLVEIFYHIDEFCKIYEAALKAKALTDQEYLQESASSVRTLSLSEIMTICIYYHHSGYKNFKSYYNNLICGYLKSAFTKLVSYNRFIELKEGILIPLSIFLKLCCTETCTGISYIDSLSLKVCHNRRIHSHKVFKDMAQRGQTSVDWFYGFKVHIVVNHLGEVINFAITPGNVADNNSDLIEYLMQDLFGKVFGDKGYLISKELYKKLYEQGIQLITKIRKNMKNILMNMSDKLLLRKRGTIESIIGILKEGLGIEHSRHRSIKNFFCHVLSSIMAYFFKPHKPSIINEDRLLEQPF